MKTTLYGKQCTKHIVRYSVYSTLDTEDFSGARLDAS